MTLHFNQSINQSANIQIYKKFIFKKQTFLFQQNLIKTYFNSNYIEIYTKSIVNIKKYLDLMSVYYFFFISLDEFLSKFIVYDVRFKFFKFCIKFFTLFKHNKNICTYIFCSGKKRRLHVFAHICG